MEQAEDKCNLIWLENLNLRGSYKSVILEYINKRYPHLVPLYREIYQKGSRGYWEGLDAAIRQLAEKRGLPYLRNDDSMHRPFNEPPVIVNYFYHEQIKTFRHEKRGASESAASRGGLQPLMSKTPDNPAWTPNSNAAGRHRMSNDTSRSNDAAFSYPHTWQ